MKMVTEEARRIPVIDEADICVVGGSCTGVFAAIRAARLGARVVLVEKHNCFGGVATSGLVNIWHSLHDTEFQKPIIAGITLEFIERLKRRNAATSIEKNPHAAAVLHSEELKIELDMAVTENRIRPHLHTLFCAPVLEDGQLTGIAVEDKSGRGAIRAEVFIDATGDGDLASRLALPTYLPGYFQPPTTCALFSGWKTLGNTNFGRLLLEHKDEFHLPEGFAWGATMPGTDIYMLAGTRVYGKNCANAEELTFSEMEGRRQVRAIVDLLRKYVPESQVALITLAAQIGIRETRHVRCLCQVTGADVLNGRRFDDAIANGSYRVDIHHQDKPGITFKYLDGTQVYVRPGCPQEAGRWRDPTPANPTFYQIPYRALVPGGHGNLILAGRMLDADSEAFAGVRVMVNMNQTGEAAGVAAALALSSGKPFTALDPQEVRKELARGGSIIL